MTRRRTQDAARGKWRGILQSLGVSEEFLRDRHGPCPLCGGSDRYRWDNNRGNGNYFCNQCGAGNGFDLLMKINGWDFATAACEVDKVVGNAPADAPKPVIDDKRRCDMLNRLWQSGQKVAPGSFAWDYLAGRGCPLPQNTNALRSVYSCPVPQVEGENRPEALPAMVAMVSKPDGAPGTLHRTFLGPNGKADISEARALMPGGLEPGSAVRLAMHGARLGIAEGIETALKAGERFGLPVWAAINSGNLSRWEPPEGVREIVIFGDNDPKFGGAAAAYALAHRLAVKGYSVGVRIPQQVGLDWADKDAA